MADDRLTDEERAALDAALDEPVLTWDGRLVPLSQLLVEDINSGRWGIFPRDEGSKDDG